MADTLRNLRDTNSLGQNGHDFIGSPGGGGFTPVVGFCVVEFVQQGDRMAYDRGAAKQHMVDKFVLGFWWNDRLNGGLVGAVGEVLKHGDLVSDVRYGLGDGSP